MRSNNGLGGTASSSATVSVTIPIPTATLNAEPAVIGIGESSNLTWNTSYAETCTIEPGIGTVDCAGGTVSVSPESTTSYALTAVGIGGTSNSTDTVTVIPAPTSALNVNPSTIGLGSSASLSWSTTNADTCAIEPDVGSVDCASGSVTVSPTATTAYTLIATGLGGTTTSTNTITVISAPTVSMGVEPQSILFGTSSMLTWNTTHAETCTLEPNIGSVDCNGSISVSPLETTTYTITVNGLGGTASSSATVSVTIPEPTVSLSATPATIAAGSSATLSWNSTYADNCNIEPDIGNVDCNSETIVSPATTTSYTITATGPGGTAMIDTLLTVQSLEPTVTISASPTIIDIGETTLLVWSTTNTNAVHIDNGVGPVTANGSLSLSPDVTTTYTISGSGPGGTVSSAVTVYVAGNPEPQPEGSFGEQYNDLIPQDATISYNEKRFSLITGQVEDESSLPLAGVAVTVHGHPEYGTVVTNDQGSFTLPVEGGDTLTVVYKKDGRIASHRQVKVGWNDYGVVETIQLLQEDSAETAVVFDGNVDTVITHRSTEIIDEFGSRSATMVFTGDNRAFLLDEEGNDVHELTSVTVRATEYVTPKSMPAKLPSNSAYTYCSEMQVDGAERVRFEKPVPIWVDNFLGFDVGEIVPVGYYDRDKAQWVPSNNGVVVRLLDTDDDGIIDALDSTGDDQPNDLNNNGIFDDEVTGLTDSGRYQSGSTFWRAEVKHFTPWDTNWPIGPPNDATPPNAPNPEPNPDNPPEDECSNTNSYVKHKTRVFHEDIPIPGTDLTLHYSSNRVVGHERVLSFPASGDTVPASLKSIIVKLEIAGKTYEENLPPEPNQGVEFAWDGKDNLGRYAKGLTFGKTSVGYVYDAVYVRPGNFPQAFAQAGVEVTGVRGREEVISWKRSEVILSQGTKDQQFGNGWTLSNHHRLTQGKLLEKGKGLSDSIELNGLYGIDTVVGGGSGNSLHIGDNGPATSAYLSRPSSLAFDATGNLLIVDSGNHRIRKVDANGVITTIAGGGPWTNLGDNGPATEANLALSEYSAIALDIAGNLLIADSGHCRIRKVDNNGIITTVAGNGNYGYSGDNGPATSAEVCASGITVDTAGNLFVVSSGYNGIRKVDNSGIITRVKHFSNSFGIAADTNDNLFITDYYDDRIVKMDTNSRIITTVAGNYGDYGFGGDYGPATSAKLSGPHGGVAFDTGGNYFIADTNNNRIRKVDTEGIITTIAGAGTAGFSGDNEPAINANLNRPLGVAVDATGNIFIADTYNNRIRKVFRSSLVQGIGLDSNELYVTEKDNTGYVFTAAGRHLRTIDSHTGKSFTTFNYDSENHLVSIDDRFGNTITIERDIAGNPTAIISPYGHRTDLTVDGTGNLTNIRFEDSTSFKFEYTNDGLMTSMTNPKNLTSTHDFDAFGYVTSTEDPENGIWTLDRLTFVDGSFTSSITSSEGNTISHHDSSGPGDKYNSTTTYPSGTIRTFVKKNQGLDETVTECGMTAATHYTLDEKSKRKIPESLILTTPAGLSNQLSIAKSYTNGADGLTQTATTTLNENGKTKTAITDYQTGTATVTSPEGRISSRTFDLTNLLVTDTEVTGLLPTHFDYDTRGRLTRVTSGDRNILYNYNTRGNLDSVVDPLNRTTSYTHDLLDRITQIDRPDGSIIHFQYDDAGNMTVLTTPTPADNVFEYNGVNKPSSYTTQLNSVTTYGYDKERQLTSVTLPSGKTITNTYTHGRLSQTDTSEWSNAYSYDCKNLPATISRGSEQLAYGYDGDLLTTMDLTGTLNQNLSYVYNNDFNVTSFAYAGATESITYDNDNLIIGIGRFTITRNSSNGLPESVTDSTITTNRTFNGYGELSAIDASVGGSNVFFWNLNRGNNGQILSKSETIDGTAAQFSYTYDEVGRLRTVTKDSVLVEEYQYDANGNRIQEMNALRGISGRTLTYSVEDHIIDAGDIIYAFDYDDNLSRRTNGSDVTDYEYSSTGELMSVILPDTTHIEYVHDPLGRRIAKKINGSIIEKYLWGDKTTLLAVYDGSDNLLQRFEYADGRMPYAMTSSGNTYYLTYDQVGSMRLVTDASGNIIKQIDYDTFGNIIADSNPSFTIPFGFAGGLHDRDTDLVRFGYRDYMPEIGKWTAKDPILFAGGDTNLYGYVRNDPVNWVDPEGLWVPQAIGAAVGLGFEGYRQYQSGNLDVGRLAMAAATGALGGFGSSLARAMLFGASANMLNTAYQQADDPCRSVNMGDVLRSGLYGAGGGSIGYAGGALGRSIFRPTNPIGQTLGQMPPHHYGASGSAIGAATGGFFANQ